MLATLALLASCATQRDAAPPVSGALDAAGLRLPTRIGPYVASLVEYGGDPTQGAFVRYLPDDSSSVLPRIDVIVYPSGGAPLANEVALAHDDLIEADRISPQIDATTLLAERLFPIAAIRDTAWRVAYSLALRDVPHHSIVWLHSTGDHFVKARISYTIRVGYDPEERVDRIVEALFASAVE